jgi:hypothetical protein
MSGVAFDVQRLAVGRWAFRHQHQHYYSNEDSLRNESSAILAISNPERDRAHRDPPRQKGT